MRFLEIIDLRDLLPPGWAEQIEAASRRNGIAIETDGSLSSRQDATRRGTTYSVVSGVEISRSLPWLDELYRGSLLELASLLTNARLFPAKSQKYGVNINTIECEGAGYEWHFDSNPVTVLLFACTLPASAGGQLLLKVEQDLEIKILPVKGLAVIFSGDTLEHSVAPLLGSNTRITVPFSYFGNSHDQVDSSLQEYLYGAI